MSEYRCTYYHNGNCGHLGKIHLISLEKKVALEGRSTEQLRSSMLLLGAGVRSHPLLQADIPENVLNYLGFTTEKTAKKLLTRE